MSKKTNSKQQAGGKRAAADHGARNRTVAAVSVVGALAAGVGAAISLGWFDRFFPGNAEHEAPDLAADAPVPGTNRAPVDFRPDPTAPVPESERDALRPATGPAPTLAANRGDMANQATPGVGE
jgi:hypothetical protein